jgi:F0F1-type ATP synthase delta subunit
MNVLGDNAEAGLSCLRAMVPPLRTIPNLFGYSASRRLEKLLRGAAGGENQAAEYTIRFITLLVQKNSFNHIDTIIKKIEDLIDVKKGILPVIVETAAAGAEDSLPAEELKRQIMKMTGAAQVKMKFNHVPGLLGGYRLRIGGFYVDASIKGQIETMTAALIGGI